MSAKKLIAAFLLIALSARGLFAFGPGDRGTAGSQFLKIGPGARAAGMGEAFSGVADDIHALYYNPAGLGNLKKAEVAGMHYAAFEGINYEFAAVSVPLLSWVDTKFERNKYGVMGLAVYSLAVSGIERRGVIETDAPSDSFGSSDHAYALSYAYAIPDVSLSLGATLKFIDLSIDDASARGFAIDAGGLYSWQKLSLGGGLRHGGAVQRFRNASDPLPLTAFMGMGYRFTDRFLAAVDLTMPRDNVPRPAVGVEYKYPFTEKLSGSGRAGYNRRNSDGGGISGSSLGLGLGYGNFDFDFAWVPFGDLGNTFRYSLHVKF